MKRISTKCDALYALAAYVISFPLFILSPCLAAHSSGSWTPIDSVHINSGNPKFPFPQFLQYQNPTGMLGNLATKSGVGVTHAEMEQTIRDAYRIDMNRSSYTGTTLNGVKYIKYQSSPDCSEGDGYGLLSAASMADKKTFDGMWLWIHDNALNKVVSYSTGQAAPAYNYSELPGWQNVTGTNSATDGDVDIAMALFTAYKQWGDSMGIKDSRGNPILYKHDLIQFLKGLTDTLINPVNGNYMCGDVGLDGYVKNGDSWGEMTDWASDMTRSGLPRIPEAKGPQANYFDYSAPSYFHLFADFLAQEDSTKYAWNIYQFRRAEASSDWLMGQLYNANPKNLPICGNVAVSGATASFSNTGSMGEDFRLAWRTILNYVWNGNPNNSWNPATHKVDLGTGNSYEQKMGARFATYLWDIRQSPWNKSCLQSTGTNPFAYWGSSMLITDINMIGNGGNFYFLNWIPSVGSPSALVAQDFNLMAQLYRYLEIEWDDQIPGDRYLTSVPKYYHGWYRLLGLLTLTGNYHTPSIYKPTANMKVYVAISKTFGFEGDSISYTIDYRNYGSMDAQGVTIVDTLPIDFIYLSSTGGGVFSSADNTVRWNIGTVSGFKTSTGVPPTVGQVKVTAKVGRTTLKQYRNRASISCSNGAGWTSNEYPNRVTSVMERNYLDIAKRALTIKKSVSAPSPKPGSTVQFSINFKNSSDAGWIDGGRSGVHFSFSQTAPNGNSNMNTMRFRLFHNADEAYIDFNNYRVSYFLYDTVNTCIQGSAGCATGWQKTLTISEPQSLQTTVKLLQEMITPGQDSFGKWNQRLILQFADPANPGTVPNLATIDHHLSQYRGDQGRIHRGGIDPLRLVWYINSSSWTNVNWANSWSWDAKADNKDDGFYFPVTNDWSDLEKPDIRVNTWNPQACSTATHTINNILVEEWDGYTWRRVAGNGPMPGRDASNVTIRDTLPAGLTFNSFVSYPAGYQPTINGNVISWSKPKMQVKDSGTIVFTANAGSSCPLRSKRVVNRAWIWADKESPVADSAIVTLTCDSVNVITPTKSTLILKNPSNQIIPSGDTAHIDTTTFNVIVTDMDQNLNSKGRDTITAKVRNPSQGDSIIIKLVETGDSTGVFQSTTPVAVVSAPPSLRGPNQISVTGGESVFITYVDPGDSTDVSQAYLITLASFPVPAFGWILDANGDGRADSAVVIYSKALSAPPDSLRFYFPDQATFQTVKTGLGAMRVNGNIITVSFGVPFAAATTAFSSGGQGSGQAFSMDGGAFRRFQFPVADSIGPILTAAQVVERIGSGIDTLYVTFSEAVQPSTLTGQSLILIKNGNPTVITIDTARQLTSTRFIVACNGADPQPLPGDSLRINATGPLRDLFGNAAHPLNPAVLITIKTIAPSIVNAYYVDRDSWGADGLVDTAVVRFNKKVDIAGLSFTVDWGGGLSALSVGGDTLSYIGTDSQAIGIAVRTVFPYTGLLKTSGAMLLTARFADFPGESRQATASDSAAPVVDTALYIFNSSDAGGCDTLIVAFSEQMSINGINPFVDSSKAFAARYSLALTPMDVRNTVARFCSVPAGTLPQSGDLIWIGPGNNVVDVPGNAQNNPNNRRAILKVTRPLTSWKISVRPNPFTPGPGSLNGGTAIDTIVIAPVKAALTLPPISARLNIFDVFGNHVFQSQIGPNDKAYRFTWDGRNRSNSLVGSGVYWAVVTVTAQDGNGVSSVNKLKIGVKR